MSGFFWIVLMFIVGLWFSELSLFKQIVLFILVSAGAAFFEWLFLLSEEIKMNERAKEEEGRKKIRLFEEQNRERASIDDAKFKKAHPDLWFRREFEREHGMTMEAWSQKRNEEAQIQAETEGKRRWLLFGAQGARKNGRVVCPKCLDNGHLTINSEPCRRCGGCKGLGCHGDAGSQCQKCQDYDDEQRRIQDDD